MLKKNKIVAVIMSVICAVGVSVAGAELSRYQSVYAGTNLSLWTTYSTVKVMRDKHDYTSLGNKISVEMVKNESESAQFIMTANTDIASYDVSVSDLRSGESVIPSSDIAVYKQGYVHVKIKGVNNFNYDYPAGWIPDFLLPMAKAVEYKENSISEGCNQGVTLDVKTTEDTVPGTYTGEVKVVADGMDYKLPFTVKVADVTIKNNSRSIFALGRNYLSYGEMDTSVEMHENYFKTMLDYKCNMYFVPGTEDSPETMISYLKKYWNHPNFNTYCLPSLDGYSTSTANIRYYKQYLRAIAKECTPEQNLLSKACTYLTSADEPWQNNSMNVAISDVNKMHAVHEEVIKELVNEGYYTQFGDKAEEFRNELEDTIRNIQLIVTDTYRDMYKDTDLSLCPTFDHYAVSDEYNNLTEHANKFNNEQWWYGCNNPKYPYPTYHIDDSLIGTRSVGWFQKQHGITGNLYWRINQFHQQFVDLVPSDKGLDPYEETNRIGSSYQADSNGEGFLLYPGKKYGSETPFPSMRLLAVRDGCDDYDLLCELEDAYSNLESYYGVDAGTFSLENTISYLYDKIGIDVNYSQDPSRMFEVRAIISELIANAKSDAKLVAFSYKLTGGKAETDFYASTDYSAKVNGETLTNGASSGAGKKYSYIQSLDKDTNKFTLELSGKGNSIVYETVMTGKSYNVTEFANNSSEGITASEKSKISIDAENAKLEFKAVSYGKSLIEKQVFAPKLMINKTVFGISSFTEIDSISIVVKNVWVVPAKITFALFDGDEELDLLTITLKAGEERTVTLKDVGGRTWSHLKTSGTFALVFENINSDNELLPDRLVSISDIYATKYAKE